MYSTVCNQPASLIVFEQSALVESQAENPSLSQKGLLNSTMA